jgi:hypothetical protein
MVYPPIHATAIFTKAFEIAAARRPVFSVSLPSLRVTKPNVIELSRWQRCRLSLHLNFCLFFWLLFFSCFDHHGG